MNRLKFVILFLLPIIACSCDRPPDLTEGEINKILNEIIAADSNYCISQVCWQYYDIEWTSDYDKVFTPADKKFANRQKRIFSDLKIKSKTIKCYWPCKRIFDYVDVVDTNWTKGGIHHFSFPLVSIDRTKVILGTIWDCNAPLCGWGDICLYVKRNGKWKIEKTFSSWQS